MCAELLPPVPSGGAYAASRGHVDLARRLPLRRALADTVGALCPDLRGRPDVNPDLICAGLEFEDVRPRQEALLARIIQRYRFENQYS